MNHYRVTVLLMIQVIIPGFKHLNHIICCAWDHKSNQVRVKISSPVECFVPLWSAASQVKTLIKKYDDFVKSYLFCFCCSLIQPVIPLACSFYMLTNKQTNKEPLITISMQALIRHNRTVLPTVNQTFRKALKGFFIFLPSLDLDRRDLTFPSPTSFHCHPLHTPLPRHPCFMQISLSCFLYFIFTHLLSVTPLSGTLWNLTTRALIFSRLSPELGEKKQRSLVFKQSQSTSAAVIVILI